MLTALSVARECGFVYEDERIIVVQAFPQQTDIQGNITEAPHIEYIYADAQPNQHKALDGTNKLQVNPCLFTV